MFLHTQNKAQLSKYQYILGEYKKTDQCFVHSKDNRIALWNIPNGKDSGWYIGNYVHQGKPKGWVYVKSHATTPNLIKDEKWNAWNTAHKTFTQCSPIECILTKEDDMVLHVTAGEFSGGYVKHDYKQGRFVYHKIGAEQVTLYFQDDNDTWIITNGIRTAKPETRIKGFKCAIKQIVIKTTPPSLFNVQPTKFKFDVFLSHNWGNDELQRDNHHRISLLNQALHQIGIITWFDEDKMEGDITQRMCEGIDNSTAVIVCITRTYNNKLNSPNRDNCKKEFQYAELRTNNLIGLVMEPDMRDTKQWTGPLGMTLGQHLYLDFTEDTNTTQVCTAILDRLRAFG